MLTPPLRAHPSRLGRLQTLDLAILIAVVAVVVIVSLPRLTAFARRENEADAQRLVRRMAELFDDDATAAAPPGSTLELFERMPRAARRQFEDQTVLDNGRLVLRHGYYFEFVHVPAFAGDTHGVMAVRAWPERLSKSGAPVFFAFSGSTVLRHTALDPAAGGMDAPPQIQSPQPFALQADGWVTVKVSDTD